MPGAEREEDPDDMTQPFSAKWTATGNPDRHGYYLGAWQRNDCWFVSELWFNPDSIGSGWWASRGYLSERASSHSSIPVIAWMPLPVYDPAQA